MKWLNQYLLKPSSIWNVFHQLVFSQLGGIHFLLMCNYDISKLPIKLFNFHWQFLGAWALYFMNIIFHHRGVLFGKIRTFYSRTNLCFMIIGLVMVCFWWSGHLIIKQISLQIPNPKIICYSFGSYSFWFVNAF